MSAKYRDEKPGPPGWHTNSGPEPSRRYDNVRPSDARNDSMSRSLRGREVARPGLVDARAGAPGERQPHLRLQVEELVEHGGGDPSDSWPCVVDPGVALP